MTSKTIVWLLVAATYCHADWKPVPVPTSASLRGLSVVSDGIIWASGTAGTIIRTEDGGKTWALLPVPGAEKLDFRGIWAWSANQAVAMSSGEAEKGLARIYRTEDGGKQWRLAYEEHTPGAFFDAIAFWDRQHGIILSDPVGGHFLLFLTDDGGANWQPIPPEILPAALPKEGAFAASNSCLTVYGGRDVWFATGGAATARVFRSTNRGHTWSVSDTPMHPANASSGIFSLAFRDAKHGWAAGGDYAHPDTTPSPNLLETTNGGKTWRTANSPGIYLSTITSETTPLAAGIAGMYAAGPGFEWHRVSGTNINALASTRHSRWAVGPHGTVLVAIPGK